ncbi:DUF3152 domain-containing protein [Brachybacterium sp. FME24]|uniref:DUF3152 domain-containing protein n=1 Tax=Brachybacterium sp. FME24 TaxID=2742605 RepID=UPI0018685B35|nr:DUF3152 domain-containing protein [Brachybacterium sp. FME24]
MPPPQEDRLRLELTRRGKLVRTGVALVAVVLLVIAVIAVVRALAIAGNAPTAATSSTTTTADGASSTGPSDAGDTEPAAGTGSTTAVAETPAASDEDAGGRSTTEELERSGDVGDGTWTPAKATEGPVPEAQTVHTYAVRVENGIDLDAEEVAGEIEAVLADDRGWTSLEDVAFQRVDSAEGADFTISLASPPSADELCLPARTLGLWNCRVGEDVVLNSDRWTTMTPTYDDLPAYRAYMVNHEVGHYLGHDHASCGGEGQPAPVMLQQSMGLDGCDPNSWPLADGER